jgi:hypothetical protein
VKDQDDAGLRAAERLTHDCRAVLLNASPLAVIDDDRTPPTRR